MCSWRKIPYTQITVCMCRTLDTQMSYISNVCCSLMFVVLGCMFPKAIKPN